MKAKKLYILFILSILGANIYAQQVSFKASAQQPVIVNKPFQISYEINANGQSFRAPEFSNFEVLAGPFTSSSSVMSNVNGQQSISLSNTYTFTLLAHQAGTFSIAPATIIVNGNKITSNGLSIKVLPPDENSKSQQQQNSAGGQATTATSISSDDLYIKTIVSRTKVFEQEAIILTYKLYINPSIGLVNCQAKKIPDFAGFMKQDIDISANRSMNYENINGRNYATIELYKVVLYPQKSGDLRIEAANFDATLRVENRKTQPRSIFDDFFNDPYIDLNRSITAPAATISASSLPTGKPADFSGAVGQFTLTPSISEQKVKANEAITLKIVISGTGNMKMIANPEIKFPASFEIYDPKVTNNFKTTTSGVSGTKTIEYMAIPRQMGDYLIPATTFSYFDTNSGSYKSLQIPAYNLHIEKGDASSTFISGGNIANKEEIKQLGNDIRYININNFKLKKEEIPLFGTITAWLMYLIPLFVALLLFFIFRKKVKENSDIILVRNRHANKVAVKRLKGAKKLLDAGKKDVFYEETLKSIWNYLSDKLNISSSELTKERVGEVLNEKGVADEIVVQLNETLNTCEFARYAPNSGQQEMGNLYENAIDLLGKMEDLLKTKN
ncbi:MAG: BatD family protein [Paludibacter sp.]|nr:BatD family protein [Paludibacter sp.]